jgi:hypothetical protein
MRMEVKTIHRDAIERAGQESIGSGSRWREVRRFPGIRSSGYKRYSLALSLGSQPTIERSILSI